ncbi:hypothetical protein Krac_6970 [Ktedonobacter racemifer DSM 44963]|uniref:Uncharacterized protein n=1 Tax=Ktedonobacter racemifer DSM 44963 TaxID=485913 RepID=D6TQ88_KTERA|nr:hypothetical protein Krac_6970 [Ktedonobacter racemifer DSM 44963]
MPPFFKRLRLLVPSRTLYGRHELPLFSNTGGVLLNSRERHSLTSKRYHSFYCREEPFSLEENV